MKFIRRIDDLGRIVIPKDVRKFFGITSNDRLEIYVQEDSIVIRKVENDE